MLRIATLGTPSLTEGTVARLRTLALEGRLDHPDPEVLLISVTERLDRGRLDAWPGLRHVVVCGTSLGRLDLATLAEREIAVHNVTHYGDHPAAEVICMQLVALLRGLGDQQWRAEPHELAGRRCTIVGLGDLGRSVAHLLQAYRCELSYVSRSAKPELDSAGVVRTTLADALPTAEVVVLTGPTDVEVLSAADLDRLADGAILVQASGGRAMDDAGFRRWIAREGNFAIFDLGVGEDLYTAYAGLPRVVFPHVVGGLSSETRGRLGDRVVDIVASLGSGRS